jgi:hypothetical protein
MNDFYGILPGEVPGFVGLAENYVSFGELPETTQIYIDAMLEHLRSLHADNPLAFESVITFVASHIDAANCGHPEPGG